MSTYLQIAAAVVTYAGGRESAKGMAKQAMHERQKARQQYLQYRQQGLEVLDEMLANAASVNAYAGAGGIDAASGSADTIATLNLAAGVGDLVTAAEGGEFALRSGVLKSEQLMTQAKATQMSAFAQSVGMLAGAAKSASSTSTTPTPTA